jgi:hypothetical protein
MPVILCGPSDDPSSVLQAQNLAARPEIKIAFRAVGIEGKICSGSIAGKFIPWGVAESAVVKKESGQVEYGNDDGPLMAIVLNDPNQAVASYLCVNTATARCIDTQAPELDDGKRLPALARSCNTSRLPSRSSKAQEVELER